MRLCLLLTSSSSPLQVLEERHRLWLSELKRLYVERLHEVAQKAERSERNLQLQLFMAQQEQRRLRKELRAQQGLAPEPRTSGPPMEADPNARPEEEARWEVGHHLKHHLLSHCSSPKLCSIKLPAQYYAVFGPSCSQFVPSPRCARRRRRLVC